MRVPDSILKCVVFVGVRDSDDTEVSFRGTGFLIAVTTEVATYIYLVTAAHVARRVDEKKFVVRMNRKTGDPVEIGTKGTRWWFHPTDSGADLAITICGLPPHLWEELDIKAFPMEMFATSETMAQRGIGIGDQAFIVGLFSQVQRTKQNIPIVRSASVAMIPNERIPFGRAGLIDAILIESRSIGGLSGSPVFVHETLSMEVHGSSGRRLFQGVGEFFLLGILVGHWDFPVEGSFLPYEAVNMGISVVVPAQKIVDVLNIPEMVEYREKWDRERVEARGSSSS